MFCKNKNTSAIAGASKNDNALTSCPLDICDLPTAEGWAGFHGSAYTVSKESAFTKAGNYLLTASVFNGLKVTGHWVNGTQCAVLGCFGL